MLYIFMKEYFIKKVIHMIFFTFFVYNFCLVKWFFIKIQSDQFSWIFFYIYFFYFIKFYFMNICKTNFTNNIILSTEKIATVISNHKIKKNKKNHLYLRNNLTIIILIIYKSIVFFKFCWLILFLLFFKYCT